MSWHVFALGHTNDKLALVPDGRSWLEKVLLPIVNLPLSNGYDSPYGEGRLFLSDLDPPAGCAFAGQFNARAEQKYAWNKFKWDGLPRRLQRIVGDGESVAAAWATDAAPCATKDWVAFSEHNHPGMAALLAEMAAFTDLPLRRDRRGLWANDFACAYEDWLKFRDFFRFVFTHFNGKYGNDLPFARYNADLARHPAYFYERVATHYFTNRTDLKVVQLDGSDELLPDGV